MIDLLFGPLAPIISALVGGVVMFLYGYRMAGKARDADEAQKRLQTMKKAQEVRDEVEALDDIGLARRASEWVRGKD